ncbi:hypothetical protein HW555_000146, partial [Spodoptera exigua]
MGWVLDICCFTEIVKGKLRSKTCLTRVTEYSFKIFQNGDLCISILHPPVDDPQSGELPCERWNPTQSVRTVLLSVISLLNEPNTFSPANVDASVMYRRWRDSKGKDKEYENIIRKQAQVARTEAEKEGIVVPLTLEDYCIKTQVKSTTQEPQVCTYLKELSPKLYRR